MSERTSCHGSHELRLKSVAASYGKKIALQGVSFEIRCGHRLGVIGPNGAGKSTLIRILAGLKQADSGQLFWQDKQLNKCVKEIAYLPQLDQHQKHFPITVREVVEMGRYPNVGIWKRLTKMDNQIIDQAVDAMDLGDLQNRQIDELSGGQQQRTYIARALAQEAHVILLDEPFNGLDRESSLHLSHSLHTLSQNGHLIIASHHNLETLEQIFDRLLVLDTRQVAFGETKPILQSDEVQAVFRCAHFDNSEAAS